MDRDRALQLFPFIKTNDLAIREDELLDDQLERVRLLKIKILRVPQNLQVVTLQELPELYYRSREKPNSFVTQNLEYHLLRKVSNHFI